MVNYWLLSKNSPRLYYLIAFIILLTISTRLININYNSAFNDEAIYIVVGQMGIFERDWWSYNAATWIPGAQYIYPTMTALAYSIGGITASRFLNVILGALLVELIFIFSVILFPKFDKKAITAGVIAAALVGGSEISYYVSRLATYDMPSFTFLFLGLLLLQANLSVVKSSKWYFLSALFISLSYITKIITGIYLPLVIAYSYLSAQRKGLPYLITWKTYFLLPTFLFLFLFMLASFDSLATYYTSQSNLEKAPISSVLNIIWENSRLIWGFYLLGSIGLFVSRQFLKWNILTLGSLMIVSFHLATNRTLSLDKHVLLMICFMAISSGIGIANLIFPNTDNLKKVKTKKQSLKNRVFLSLSRVRESKYWQGFWLGLLGIALVIYWVIGYQSAAKFNTRWQNLSAVEKQLEVLVEDGDKVLVESGAATILATYEKNYPLNTTTFDWLDYQGSTGQNAYAKAVRDGYFEVIQLESQNNPKSNNNFRLNQIIRENMSGNYETVFDDGKFSIYKRKF